MSAPVASKTWTVAVFACAFINSALSVELAVCTFARISFSTARICSSSDATLSNGTASGICALLLVNFVGDPAAEVPAETCQECIHNNNERLQRNEMIGHFSPHCAGTGLPTLSTQVALSFE